MFDILRHKDFYKDQPIPCRLTYAKLKNCLGVLLNEGKWIPRYFFLRMPDLKSDVAPDTEGIEETAFVMGLMYQEMREGGKIDLNAQDSICDLLVCNGAQFGGATSSQAETTASFLSTLAWSCQPKCTMIVLYNLSWDASSQLGVRFVSQGHRVHGGFSYACAGEAGCYAMVVCCKEDDVTDAEKSLRNDWRIATDACTKDFLESDNETYPVGMISKDSVIFKDYGQLQDVQQASMLAHWLSLINDPNYDVWFLCPGTTSELPLAWMGLGKRLIMAGANVKGLNFTTKEAGHLLAGTDNAKPMFSSDEYNEQALATTVLVMQKEHSGGISYFKDVHLSNVNPLPRREVDAATHADTLARPAPGATSGYVATKAISKGVQT
jgi:hypothetical protein